MKLLLFTYVFCFFQPSENVSLYYRYGWNPFALGQLDAPQCVKLPEKEYVMGFLVIHQTC